MAPTAATEANSNSNNNNWLSFSLSPMEMLANSHQQSSHILPSQHYFLDSFYPPATEWENQKTNNQQAEEEMQMYTNYTNMINNNTIPKLEDFFNDNNNNNNNNNNTETTHDSSPQLTHYYYNPPMLTTTGFHSNSDDSGSVTTTTQSQSLGCAEIVAHSVEPELVAVSDAVNGGSLSLAVAAQQQQPQAVEKTGSGDNSLKKSSEGFGQRTSIYRGVTRHRWTGRYEAHLWDNSCRREGQARKGRQVYLGGYDKEDKAARAYDLAALKYWGTSATTNFPVTIYTQEIEDMQLATKQEFIASLRRKSSGFSRGASIYRGVTRHHQQGRWQARIGRVAGNKDLYLGTFSTEEEAAEAYDIAAIKFRGVNAVTNFEMNRYDVDAILNSNLPVGGAAKRLKLATEAGDQKPTLSLTQHSHSSNETSGYSSTIDFSAIQPVPQMTFDAATAFFHQNLLHHLSTNGNGNGLGHAMTLDNFGSNAIAPMSLMPQTPAEFYIWPNQSY